MSELSNKAKQRNFLKLRLSGCYSIFNNVDETNITKEESILIEEISLNISHLLHNFKSNSIKLGFKASDRCYLCGKKAVNDIFINGYKKYICSTHNDSIYN